MAIQKMASLIFSGIGFSGIHRIAFRPGVGYRRQRLDCEELPSAGKLGLFYTILRDELEIL